jgi:hypothetical protein
MEYSLNHDLAWAFVNKVSTGEEEFRTKIKNKNNGSRRLEDILNR